jgi:hypothetical protein
LAGFLDPADEDVFQYQFFNAPQNVLDRMKKCFLISELIFSQELFKMVAKTKVQRGQIWYVWLMRSFFHRAALHQIQGNLCSLRMRVIGVHDEFSIRPSDLSSAPN